MLGVKLPSLGSEKMFTELGAYPVSGIIFSFRAFYEFYVASRDFNSLTPDYQRQKS